MTAILTYHLGWVSNHLSEQESLNLPKEPLRKQLSELYGCTGHPKRVSQTLLIGSQNGLIDRVINVLGYFIRCSPVEWRKYEKCPLDFEKINNEMCDAENCDCGVRNEKKSVEDLEDETTVKKSDVLTVKQPMKKNKSLLGNLNDLNTMENIEIVDESDKGDVIFVLGENERLQGLKLNQNVNVIKKGEPKKHRYSGVKFNFQQYPQIFENYMKSKNIELPSISTNKKFDGFGFSSSNTRTVDFSQYDNTSDDDEEDEPLQTPSNASEMESTNEFSIEKPEYAKAIETIQKRRKSVEFVRQHQKNTVLVAEPQLLLKFIHLPLPRYETQKIEEKYAMYANTLFRGFHNHYISNVLIQGVNSFANWQMCLKRDLVLCAKHPSIDETIEESLAIIANTDIWEVQVMSSHTFVINKSASGVAIGMSQLVGNMLETLVHLWRLKVPPKYCLMHVEQKLREFYERSKAVAQLLLDTDFCSMELLTSSLKLDVNDVPLLLAVASVHTPEVMQRYGLSFQ